MRKWIVAAALCLVPIAAVAQTVTSATVTTNAPIYVTSTPSANLAPLRVAAEGTVLRVVGSEQGDWLQVEFEDPRWGRRTGWVQKRHVRVSDPHVQPMDLSIGDGSVTDPTAPRDNPGSGRSEGVARKTTAVDVPQGTSFATSPERANSQVRDGFWFNVGLGGGSLGCDGCVVRENGLSGGLSFGGTIGDKWLFGVGTTGWAKEDAGGEMLTVGTLDARFRFYPARSSGFFLTSGLGLGSISLAGESEFGVGVIVGAGWDIRVGSNVSLTPFYNGFAMRNSLADANVGQLGIGVTIH